MPTEQTTQVAMLVLRDDGVDWTQHGNDGPGGKALFQRFVDWAADLDRRGLLAGVDALAQGGRTVRKKGASIVIDGPYAEGREAVLGYFLVRARDLDEACAIAAESPHAEIGGAVEVRMVGAFPKPGR